MADDRPILTAVVRSNYGACPTRLDQRDKGRDELAAALHTLQSQLGSEHVWTRLTHSRLSNPDAGS